MGSVLARASRAMRRFLRDNGLSLALAACFLIFLFGESVTGYRYYNQEEREHGGTEISYPSYLTSAHFLSATMENWESEFFQMAVYVYFTIFLFQRGSAESKDPDEKEEVDRDPRGARHRKDAPGPVRRGGWVLWLYGHSLGLAFVLLFLVSFGLHAAGSLAEFNQEQILHGEPTVRWTEFLRGARFWFESFQNWQSEFLAIGSMVVLSIFLRQKGSPESKPVDAPHSETGGG
jgi:hypothetical protein